MIQLTVNGETHAFEGEGDLPLLWYLRDFLGLTGSKYGCGKGLCGACTVHLDGQAIRSCSVTMDRLDGRQHHDHRRAGRGWRASTSDRLGGTQGAAVRVLPVRADHAGGGVAGRQSGSGRTADRRRHERRDLPLWHVPAYPGGDQVRCRIGGGRWRVNPFQKFAARPRPGSGPQAIQQISRRDFLKTGGVFVIGVSLFGCGPESAPIPVRPVSTDAVVARRVCQFRRGRNRAHHFASQRNGPGHSHRAAGRARRRDGSRLGPGRGRTGHG